jgi:hypothetical protein
LSAAARSTAATASACGVPGCCAAFRKRADWFAACGQRRPRRYGPAVR